MFPDNAWSEITKPMLILTGTRDKSMQTGEYTSRRIPYESLTPGCKWLGVIDGATHMNFAGIGLAGTTEKLTLIERNRSWMACAAVNAEVPFRQRKYQFRTSNAKKTAARNFRAAGQPRRLSPHEFRLILGHFD